jgi:putative transcriptional regulator
MLSENIKNFRKKKGLSQEELAIQLNVVRQTVSKWEKGLSVPDSEMLITLAEKLDTPVNVLLGESVEPSDTTELQALASKLELLNEQFAKHNECRRKTWRTIFLILGIIAIACIVKDIIGDIYYLILMDEIHASSSVIGGLDGPTTISVSGGNMKIGKILTLTTIAILSIVGVYKMRKK